MRTLILFVGLLAVAGCADKEHKTIAPPKPLAWADGHYLCDRLKSPIGKPVSTGDVSFTIIGGEIQGTVRQSTNNAVGVLPDVIAVTYDFTGSISPGTDGGAVFDVAGQIPAPASGPFHLQGEVRPKGIFSVKVQSSIEVSVTDIDKASGANSDGARPDSKIPPRKMTKKQFAMEGEGLGVKR